MWQTPSSLGRKETEFLSDYLTRLLVVPTWSSRARAVLSGAAEAEPIVAELLQTPQDIRFHAEGPFVKSHLERMLTVLYAINERGLEFDRVEECVRDRSLRADWESVEHCLRERVAFFEAFTFLHDAAKWSCLTCSAPVGSRGAALGFNTALTYEFSADAFARTQSRQSYLELFHEFARRHTEESPTEVQELFYREYGISVHYPHHDTAIFTPVYQQLIDRFVRAHELSVQDRALLEDLIAHHMMFAEGFDHVSTRHLAKFAHLAQKRGYDVEMYLTHAFACLFLDMVCGSVRADKTLSIDRFVNALKSAQDFAPEQRARKEQLRAEKKARERNQLFQKVGLDGVALMELLGAEPGPAFGRQLKQIHAAVLGEGELPPLGVSIRQQIEARAQAFYQHLFKSGI